MRPSAVKSPMSLTSPFLLAFSSRLCTLPQPLQIHSRIEGWDSAFNHSKAVRTRSCRALLISNKEMLSRPDRQPCHDLSEFREISAIANGAVCLSSETRVRVCWGEISDTNHIIMLVEKISQRVEMLLINQCVNKPTSRGVLKGGFLEECGDLF
jgi:hypothetical protein